MSIGVNRLDSSRPRGRDRSVRASCKTRADGAGYGLLAAVPFHHGILHPHVGEMMWLEGPATTHRRALSATESDDIVTVRSREYWGD
jgi:hypothetical protein